MKTDSGMRHGRWKHKGQREREGNEGRGNRENRPAEVRGGGATYLESTFSCIIDAVSCVTVATWKMQHLSNAINSTSRNNTIWEDFCKKNFKPAKQISRVSLSVITTI